mmetsp:Transcript_7491/g.18568  ORF Transcript_7491/g.18568 Transcript_7491/m.18568 type:complete len:97 (+) Transcript_7491:360-650(+)
MSQSHGAGMRLAWSTPCSTMCMLHHDAMRVLIKHAALVPASWPLICQTVAAAPTKDNVQPHLPSAAAAVFGSCSVSSDHGHPCRTPCVWDSSSSGG